MNTVHAIANLLPAPVELRAHLRALAVLDTAIADDPQYCYYTFDVAWGPGEEAALMENGSGDDFSVLFTPAGVLIRGFDHESAMSPYGTDDEQVWPGVIDEVPAALRPLLDEPAFCDEGINALLRRVAAHPEAASYLACDGEFDLRQGVGSRKGRPLAACGLDAPTSPQ